MAKACPPLRAARLAAATHVAGPPPTLLLWLPPGPGHPIGRRSGCDCPTSTIIHAPQVERNHTSIAAQALHQGAAAPI
ncbi:MAG: hypothetical protein ACREX3_05160, partial [Gammaproteobacteria bacterium]